MAKKEDKIQKLDLSDEFLLDSAENRFEAGDYLGALTMLNKRGRMYEPSADACALYADVYEEMGLYSLAADSWFRFLDTCNEADFSEGYEGLAVSFMNMGDEMQSALYYHRILEEDKELPEESREEIIALFGREQKPRISLVHSADGGAEEDCSETLHRGLYLLRSGDLEGAKSALSEIPEDNSAYPSAAGISAMCTLLSGDEEGAERECEELLRAHPDNVQALTTYCAVLGARDNKEGAKKIARRLAEMETDSTEDLYRIATALCETGLDEEAREKLTRLKKSLPYDNNVLYFHAVACYRTGHTEEAIESLELLCTLYPRAAVAEYYLVRMRELRDGTDKPFPMNYYYRLPEEEYRTVADFLLAAHAKSAEEAEDLAALPELKNFFRIAFDELEGRDEKLQVLASKVAVKCRCDSFVREALLDYEGDEFVKFSILHDLTMRNEENSFGTVILDIYKEFYTHKIEIGTRKRKRFLTAFADVYSKFALLGEENEEKLLTAAEDVYAVLEEADAWECMDEREALAAVIYREARLHGGERKLEDVANLFGAKKPAVQKILDYII